MVTSIRTGESAPQVPVAKLKDPTTRVFHHMIPGARFMMPDGLEVMFLGGQFTTQDPEIIAELDKVADKPASMIYTKAEIAASVKAASKAAADDAQTS